MKRAKRILAPIDLTENSRRGVRYAFSLSLENDADLMILHVARLFHVWDRQEDFYPCCPSLHAWAADRVVSEAALDLTRFLEQHLREALRMQTVTRKVVLGDTATSIIQVADEEDIELIVMAPRPEHGFKRFLLGSVTDRVIREAPCPVLAMSPPRAVRPAPGNRAPAAFHSAGGLQLPSLFQEA